MTTGASLDLFDGLEPAAPVQEPLAPGALVLRGFALAMATDLVDAVNAVSRAAPFRLASACRPP